MEALLLPQPKSAEEKIPIISGLRRGRKNEKSGKEVRGRLKEILVFITSYIMINTY